MLLKPTPLRAVWAQVMTRTLLAVAPLNRLATGNCLATIILDVVGQPLPVYPSRLMALFRVPWITTPRAKPLLTLNATLIELLFTIVVAVLRGGPGALGLVVPVALEVGVVISAEADVVGVPLLPPELGVVYTSTTISKLMSAMVMMLTPPVWAKLPYRAPSLLSKSGPPGVLLDGCLLNRLATLAAFSRALALCCASAGTTGAEFSCPAHYLKYSSGE